MRTLLFVRLLLNLACTRDFTPLELAAPLAFRAGVVCNVTPSSHINVYCCGYADAAMPDCSKAIAREPYGVAPSEEETEACRKLCMSLKSSCNAVANENAYKACFVDPFRRPAFADRCTFTAGTEQVDKLACTPQ